MALTFRSVSSASEVSSGDLTLTEPTGAASGDLLVASIAYRDTATFTLPSGWTIVGTQQSSGNTSTTTSASIASGLMAYIVRGGSAPDLTFTRTGGDVALGRIVAYTPGSGETISFDAGSANTLGANSTTVTTTAITTANDLSLLVMAECLADNTTASRARATDPDEFIWRERADSNTATGADTGLAVSDAYKLAAGSTGTLTYTAGNSSRHVCIVGAFYTSYTGVKPKVVASGSVVGSSSNVVTSSFTPAANTLLIVQAASDADIDLTTAAAITDSATLSWTQIEHTVDDSGGFYEALTSWWAVSGSSPSSMTVTVNPQGTSAATSCVVAVFEVAGADTSSPIGAQVENAHITDTQSITLSGTPAATSVIFQAATSFDFGSSVTRHVVAANDCIEAFDTLVQSGDPGVTLGVQLRFCTTGTGTGMAWADVMEGATVASADLTVTHAFEVKAGTSNVSLTAPKLSSGSTLRAHTVTPVLSATAPLLSSGSVLRGSSLQLQLSAPKLGSTSVLYGVTASPVITTSPPLLASGSVLRATSVALHLSAPKVDSASELRDPSTALTLAAPRITSASVLRDHSVAPVITVTAPLRGSVSVLRDHTVTPVIALTSAKLSSASALFAPTITVNEAGVTLSAPLLQSTSALHDPSLALQATLTAPKLDSAGTLYGTSVTFTLAAPLLASVSVLRDHSVAPVITVSPDVLASSGALHTPTLDVAGAVTPPAETPTVTTGGGGAAQFYRGRYRRDIRKAIRRALDDLSGVRSSRSRKRRVRRIATQFVAEFDFDMPSAALVAMPDVAMLEPIRLQILQTGLALRQKEIEADVARAKAEEMGRLFAAYEAEVARIEREEEEEALALILSIAA